MTRYGIYEIICTVLTHGDIAQLVERLNGIEKVRGSTPLISTISFFDNPATGIFFLFFFVAKRSKQKSARFGFIITKPRLAF